MFCHFWSKFENSKWPPFLGRGKFFENCQEDISQIPWGMKIFDEITLSRTVKEIEANLKMAKIRKFKMAAIFGEGKFFLKFAKSTLLRYPVGRKFRRNLSISHG